MWMRGRFPMPSKTVGTRAFTASVAVLGVLTSIALAAGSAQALQAKQTRLVSAIPGTHTPAINNGVVSAIAQVGNEIFLGGTFTSVSPVGNPSKSYTVDNMVAFNARTGALALGFQPKMNGSIATIAAGPSAQEVYVGGDFTWIDGRQMRVALLNTSTGKIVSGWRPSSMIGIIGRVILTHGRLFVGGSFTTVGGKNHDGLVALVPKTGKVTSYINLNFTGHHNYGVNCHPRQRSCANGRVGLKAMDINAAGTRLVAIGNFTHVGGVQRDQVAVLELGKKKVWVDPRWATGAYTAGCDDGGRGFDSYVRDVQFAPNGSYFVVVATGGRGTNHDGSKSSCDAAARFNTHSHGKDIRPVWLDYTGEDSLWSVAVTGTAVYVGGHQRWQNNPLGRNRAAEGAVPRPGLAALSPLSGLPLAWNPGRNPRGNGAFALLATSRGLWVGSDTDQIGPPSDLFTRPKIAFFPLVGGAAVPANFTPALPGRLYLAGATSTKAANPNRLAFREFNGRSLGKERTLSTAVPWGSVRGAFTVAGKVIYGKSDGNLYQRSFNGAKVGHEVELDPFNDPIWDNVHTGSDHGLQTYQGAASTFTAEIPSVTSMFYRSGRLYYTLANRAAMHWRWFTPQPGVVGATEFTVHSSLNWSHVEGAVLSGGRLYYASKATGQLHSVRWSAIAPKGKTSLVSAAKDWASRGLFVLSNHTYPTPHPSAAFTASCSASRCRFRAQPWVDPDGGVVKYAWRFGDGKSATASISTKASHRYTRKGRHRVRLTVVTTGGSTASISHHVKAPK
jgi:PKD domain